MATSVRALLDTVVQALPEVGNLGLLFFLLFYIFAALGVELFGRVECSDVHPCEGLSKHAHFRNFGIAFLTLFRVATGDNWNGIMKDTLREECDSSPDCIINCCVSPIVAPVFFVIFVLMAQFVLVNVVVAVLMKHLEESHKNMDDDADLEAEIEQELEREEQVRIVRNAEAVHRRRVVHQLQATIEEEASEDVEGTGYITIGDDSCSAINDLVVDSNDRHRSPTSSICALETGPRRTLDTTFQPTSLLVVGLDPRLQLSCSTGSIPNVYAPGDSRDSVARRENNPHRARSYNKTLQKAFPHRSLDAGPRSNMDVPPLLPIPSPCSPILLPLTTLTCRQCRQLPASTYVNDDISRQDCRARINEDREACRTNVVTDSCATSFTRPEIVTVARRFSLTGVTSPSRIVVDDSASSEHVTSDNIFSADGDITMRRMTL